ncbi:hypothetical protein PAPYR_2234 [Paratrimastix pyriformis]|uniref:Uncharacterized protein n=1 Tax=Paratrimastix pyriformis TaxID=342808 RepID=A0ABQ8URQ0_9EUKA|nr:hypothetical protein PAPYR_2234 [Paratrimastix pyriformis]
MSFESLFAPVASLLDRGFSTKGGISVKSRLSGLDVMTSFTPSKDPARIFDANVSARQQIVEKKIFVDGTLNHMGDVTATCTANEVMKGLGFRALLDPTRTRRPTLGMSYSNRVVAADVEAIPFSHAKISTLINLPDTPLHDFALGLETNVDHEWSTPLNTIRMGLNYSRPGLFSATFALEDRMRKTTVSFVHSRALPHDATLTYGLRYIRHLLPNPAELAEGEAAPMPLFVADHAFEFGTQYARGTMLVKGKMDLAGAMNLSVSRRFCNHVTVGLSAASHLRALVGGRCFGCGAKKDPLPPPVSPLATIGLSLLFE